MKTIRPSFYLYAALALTFTTASLAAEGVPTDLAAKRTAKTSLTAGATPNMVYTPITPCRVLRPKTILAAGSTTAFKITGDGNFNAQGGPAFGCGVPDYAKAITINLTADHPASPGILKVFPAGTPVPAMTALSYRSGINITSGTNVALGAQGQISVFVSGATKLAGDITGYYEPQLWAYVGSNGTLIDSSGRVQSVTRNSAGNYTVNFDRSVEGCAAVASSDLSPVLTSAFTNASGANVRTTAVLGLLPVDGYFNLFVKC